MSGEPDLFNAINKQDLIDQAAALMEAGHSTTAHLLLSAAMHEVAMNYPSSGLRATERWIAAMQALGETCITIAKRERARFK